MNNSQSQGYLKAFHTQRHSQPVVSKISIVVGTLSPRRQGGQNSHSFLAANDAIVPSSHWLSGDAAVTGPASPSTKVWIAQPTNIHHSQAEGRETPPWNPRSHTCGLELKLIVLFFCWYFNRGLCHPILFLLPLILMLLNVFLACHHFLSTSLAPHYFCWIHYHMLKSSVSELNLLRILNINNKLIKWLEGKHNTGESHRSLQQLVLFQIGLC